jgi:hypothetical protein
VLNEIACPKKENKKKYGIPHISREMNFMK